MRRELSEGLVKAGMEVIPGDAGFLLFRSEKELYQPMLRRGILIRRCGNFEGLDDHWYRIAVRKQKDDREFLRVLREITEEDCP